MAIAPNNYPFSGGAFMGGANTPVNREDIHTLTLAKGGSSLGQYNPLIGDTTIAIPSDASDDTSTFMKASGDTSSMASGSKLSALFTAISSFFASVLSTIGGKADKVGGATSGNFASLDANGNLTDSGKKASDFKTKQTAVPDLTADGTGLSFIDSVTQNANGEITPHKKTVQDGTTTQKGVVQLQDSVGSTESATDRAVTPHAVRAAIDSAVSSAYHAAGTKTVVQLTRSLLVAENEGCVYNVTDSGTTTPDFVDGAGHPINAGDNVVVCDIGGDVYRFDLLSGFIDLSNYLTKTGDASDATSTFTKNASDTSSMTSGSKLSAIFTAISNVFASFKALAFKDKASYSDLSSGVQSSLDKADSALQAAIEYVTTSSTWQTLETAYNAGKTLILKVENGTNCFDEYRLTAVNKSSGSDRFIFCGFPTMVNLEGGSVESLEVTEWVCRFEENTTRWTTTTVDGLELPTKGYVTQVAATKVEFIENSDSNVIGSNAPCADCKTFFADNVTAGKIKMVYNTPGEEYTIIFSKQSNGNYGNILKYGFADKYLRIMRCRNSNWISGDDWEKISAGYADSAGRADMLTRAAVSSGQSNEWWGIKLTHRFTRRAAVTIRCLVMRDNNDDNVGIVDIVIKERTDNNYNLFAIVVCRNTNNIYFENVVYADNHSTQETYIGINVGSWGSTVIPMVIGDTESNRSLTDRSIVVDFGDYHSTASALTSSNASLRRLAYSTDFADRGNSSQPAYMDTDGSLKPCNFSVNFGNPVSGANVLNIVTA